MADEKKPSGLAAKMAAAMAEIGRVAKRGHNTAQDYKFVRSDDVAEEARTVLAKYGIALFADVLEDSIREIVIPPAKEGFTGKTLRVSRVRVAWTFKDSESGEERTVHTPGEGMDSGDKGIYKAMTGAMKYALMLGFLIPTGDADPEKAGEADEVERHEQAAAGATTADKVKDKVAKANGGARPTPIEAYKEEAFKEVCRLLGNEARAKAWLCGIRSDPKGLRAWTESDAEKVKQQLVLLRARANAAKGGLIPAEEMTQ